MFKLKHNLALHSIVSNGVVQFSAQKVWLFFIFSKLSGDLRWVLSVVLKYPNPNPSSMDLGCFQPNQVLQKLIQDWAAILKFRPICKCKLSICTPLWQGLAGWLGLIRSADWPTLMSGCVSPSYFNSCRKAAYTECSCKNGRECFRHNAWFGLHGVLRLLTFKSHGWGCIISHNHQSVKGSMRLN